MRRATGTKTTSLGQRPKDQRPRKVDEGHPSRIGASVCATTTGNPSNVQLAAPWF